MAQLGADVIKCEPPWGDIINKSAGARDGRPSDLYIAANLGKRGIHLNMKEAADRERFLELIATADVYMDNLRADAADRLGIGYAVCSAVNPRLVFVNSSGFGAKGPLRSMGSFEQYSDAFSGVSSITGEEGGTPERLAGLRVDPYTACCLVHMVLAGLLHRERTGRGQKIVGSQFESAIQLAMVRAVELNFGVDPAPMGSQHPHVVPSGAFVAADGYVAVTAETERQWRDLCVVIGRPELMFDPQFETNARRLEHRAFLMEEIAPWFTNQTVRESVNALQARRVPAGEFLTPARQHDDPQVAARELLRVADTPWGPVRVPMMTARFSKTPTVLGAAMLPGQHTDEVLAELRTIGEPTTQR
jgi:CoA:oxalate CoA-transferase